MQAILSRRSIRKYTAQPVAESDVHRLLEAGMNAPSSANGQPWHFVVITDRKTLDAVPSFHPYSGMIKEAPLALVVCGDAPPDRISGAWVQDCSAATENILVAANAIGLGAVWLGVHPIEERVAGVRRLLELPDGIRPLCIIVVGHPAESKPPANRFNPDRVHRDRW